MTSTTESKLEASFSLLTMSIASNAMMAMGLTADPQNGKTEIDKNLARFNIDLLLMLKEKTKSNLNSDEIGLIEHVLKDLQMKFIQTK
jgi:hypothetical protein